MTAAKSSNGDLEDLRVIVYREGELYIAQGIDHDIATQAPDITTLLERLDLTIDAECAMSRDRGDQPFVGIPPAPNYFHTLWDQRSVSLARLQVPVHQHLRIEVALAKAA